jgi:hypothetical protein
MLRVGRTGRPQSVVPPGRPQSVGHKCCLCGAGDRNGLLGSSSSASRSAFSASHARLWGARPCWKCEGRGALNPKERAKLGAHYTPRAYVERLVMPTIVEPLRGDWLGVRAAAVKFLDAGDQAAARRHVEAFHAKLAQTKVLDPADLGLLGRVCGPRRFAPQRERDDRNWAFVPQSPNDP